MNTYLNKEIIPEGATSDDVKSYLEICLHVLLDLCKLHPTKYTHIFSDFELEGTSCEEIYEDCYLNTENNDDKEDKLNRFLAFMDILDKDGWDTIIFKNVKKIIFQGNKTGNTSDEGGGCGRFDFALNDFRFPQKYENGNVTIKDLIDGIYRTKGSKYDTVFEWFAYFNVGDFDNGKMEFRTYFNYNKKEEDDTEDEEDNLSEFEKISLE